MRLHCDLNSSDETQWAHPAWCDIRSLYPEDQDTPVFSGRDLRKKNFNGSRLVMAEFAGADAESVEFVRAELSGSDFRGADVRRANFYEADLCSVDFRDANLAGACLAGADLTQARFSGANLSGANLSGSCLEGTDLCGARYDKTTELPFDINEANRRGMQNSELTSGPAGGIYE